MQNGRLVALPTETVYGLAALATDETAVSQIFEAKNRPRKNPLICHFATPVQICEFAVADPQHEKLYSLWPGPLTILLPVIPGKLPVSVTAGSELLGVRIPDHPLTLEVLKKVYPLAAPSANLSGRTSSTGASHAADQFGSKIAGVVDGGRSKVGLESTVVLPGPGKTLRILRPGAVTAEKLESLGYRVESKQNLPVPAGKGLLSPGQLPVHYQPSIPVILIERHPSDTAAIQKLKDYLINIPVNEKTAVLWYEGFPPPQELTITDAEFLSLSAPYNPVEKRLSDLASSLYFTFIEQERKFDRLVIVAAPETGIGKAVNDRLRRAATETIRL